MRVIHTWFVIVGRVRRAPRAVVRQRSPDMRSPTHNVSAGFTARRSPASTLKTVNRLCYKRGEDRNDRDIVNQLRAGLLMLRLVHDPR